MNKITSQKCVTLFKPRFQIMWLCPFSFCGFLEKQEFPAANKMVLHERATAVFKH